MKILLTCLLIFLNLNNPIKFEPEKMSPEEVKLLNKINAYRKSKGLNPIQNSANLNLVAQLHAKELQEAPPEGKCNMHSWTGKFGEKPCCYTSDNKEAACMWSKPSEFSSYKGNGYEIAAFNTDSDVDWLAQWKESPGHHAVIINLKNWKTIRWNAIGIAIREPYAVVWFGEETDPVKGN